MTKSNQRDIQKRRKSSWVLSARPSKANSTQRQGGPAPELVESSGRLPTASPNPSGWCGLAPSCNMCSICRREPSIRISLRQCALCWVCVVGGGGWWSCPTIPSPVLQPLGTLQSRQRPIALSWSQTRHVATQAFESPSHRINVLMTQCLGAWTAKHSGMECNTWWITSRH